MTTNSVDILACDNCGSRIGVSLFTRFSLHLCGHCKGNLNALIKEKKPKRTGNSKPRK